MCDDAMPQPDEQPGEQQREGAVLSEISRRRLLAGGGAAALGLVAGEWLSPAGAAAAGSGATPAAAAGLQPWSMAMHIHSSFSEQSGSMDSHLFQATKNAVDVCWWTDHDYRMTAVEYRSVVHFTSLTTEATDHKPWLWQRQNSGSLSAASGGSIVSSPASPNDPIAGSSLKVTAQSKTASPAAVRFFAQAHQAGWNYQTNLYGQTLTIDVRPATVASGGYLELLIGSSYHQATHGRPAGIYTLSYRFDGTARAATRSAQGLQGIITLPAPAGQWTTVSVTPTDDIAAIWPDMAATDFASQHLYLGAVSTGGLTTGNFDYLRFTRNFISGDIPLQTQQQLENRYATAYPAVQQYQGLEISEFLPHLNWFGSGVHIGNYQGVTPKNWATFCGTQVSSAHASGAIVSYNHPFGYSSGPKLPTAQQDSLLGTVATKLLGNKALNCDVLEVGYALRSGVDLKHHVGLWDVMSRNALFLTGNGTTDDHFGTNWLGLQNNWITSAWAPTIGETDLVAAMKAGRAWSGSLSAFRGTLDLVADGTAPMGSVTVSTAVNRSLRLVATGMPAGSTLQLIRGAVDLAGTAHPMPTSAVLQSFPASALAGGSVTVTANNSASAFYRTQVVNSAGVVVAASNPVWLLRSAPPGGIPAPRAA